MPVKVVVCLQLQILQPPQVWKSFNSEGPDGLALLQLLVSSCILQWVDRESSYVSANCPASSKQCCLLFSAGLQPDL